MIYGVPEGFDQNKNSDLCHTVMGFALNCPVFKTMASNLYCQAQILSSAQKIAQYHYSHCPGTVLQSLMIYHCNGGFAAYCRTFLSHKENSHEEVLCRKMTNTYIFEFAHCSVFGSLPCLTIYAKNHNFDLVLYISVPA